jgi:nucleoside-diphosphate-sugar epimerase
MLIPRLIDTISAGGQVRLAGADGALLNPVHVEDVVIAIAHALEHEVSGTLNVAGPETLSIREMSEVISRFVGASPRFTQDDSGEAQDLRADITAMRELLVPPRRSFAEAVSGLVDQQRRGES